LIGKTAHISPNSTLVFEALLRGQGIDPAQVNIVTRTDFTIAPLTSGDADVIDAWVTNEVPILQLQNVAYNAIFPSDYGIEVYPNAVVTTQDNVANKADLVARFVRATLKGIQDTIDDPAGAAQFSIEYNQELDLAQEQKSVEQSLPLLNPAGSHPGMMTADVWQFTEQTLLDQGILTSAVDVNAAFTLQFLNQIYRP
jgi:NitT/TauT family transport system substrate-binding protein